MSMASVVTKVFSEYNQALVVLGAAAGCYLALTLGLSLWRGVKAYLLAGPLGLATDLRRLGSWAVVTGATDGIGKGYCQELARRGLNIVLLSRSPEKLSDVAGELERQYKVETRTVAVDFTKGQEIYDKIKTQLAGLDIGTLVNNVGMSFSFAQYFGEQENAMVNENIIRVNTFSVVKMTEIVLPVFLEKKKGAIINIASSSGVFTAAPLLSTYGASKAFVAQLTRSLQEELKGKGIIVQVVYPFFVATKMSKIRHSSLMVPDPVSYARSALKTVGVEGETYGCWPHALTGWLLQVLPQWLVKQLIYTPLKKTRARALKKLQDKHSRKED